MKKVNRYRNNNNSIYSLNYKFDSNSIAGKISGTALDLIRRYNDMAKDAHSNNDYVAAEIFRQYAEHYRKIVTEINERKAPREQMEGNANDNANSVAAENVENNPIENHQENNVETAEAQSSAPEEVAKPAVQKKRAFHIVEVAPSEAVKENAPTKVRRPRKAKVVAEQTA